MDAGSGGVRLAPARHQCPATKGTVYPSTAFWSFAWHQRPRPLGRYESEKPRRQAANKGLMARRKLLGVINGQVLCQLSCPGRWPGGRLELPTPRLRVRSNAKTHYRKVLPGGDDPPFLQGKCSVLTIVDDGSRNVKKVRAGDAEASWGSNPRPQWSPCEVTRLFTITYRRLMACRGIMGWEQGKVAVRLSPTQRMPGDKNLQDVWCFA